MTPQEILDIKSAVRARDGFRCTECGMTAEEHIAATGKTLEVHRLTPGSPYSLEGCVTLCRKCHGPKPRSRRGSSPWRTLRLSYDLAVKAKLISESKGLTIAEYLSALLRPHIDKDWPKALGALDLKANPPE